MFLPEPHSKGFMGEFTTVFLILRGNSKQTDRRDMRNRYINMPFPDEFLYGSSVTIFYLQQLTLILPVSLITGFTRVHAHTQ